MRVCIQLRHCLAPLSFTAHAHDDPAAAAATIQSFAHIFWSLSFSLLSVCVWFTTKAENSVLCGERRKRSAVGVRLPSLPTEMGSNISASDDGSESSSFRRSWMFGRSRGGQSAFTRGTQHTTSPLSELVDRPGSPPPLLTVHTHTHTFLTLPYLLERLVVLVNLTKPNSVFLWVPQMICLAVILISDSLVLICDCSPAPNVEAL